MKDKIANSLYHSGIALIELGIEDYQLAKNDNRRLATSTRNLFDGLLTLLKAKIAEDHPENNYAWLRWKNGVPPKSPVEMRQLSNIQDAKTIGVNETLEYFSGKLDMARIESLRQYRNKATHFSLEIAQQAAKEMLARFFLTITDGLNAIGLAPKECFSDNVLFFVAKETGDLQDEIHEAADEWYNSKWMDYDVASLIFENFCCEKCGSTLVRILTECNSKKSFSCRVCGEQYSESDLRELVCKKCECIVCGDSILPEELECYVESHMCGWHHHVYENEMSRD